jgi:hypothetical protein
MPFSALAGIDLNGDGFNSDYVPGTTRNVFNRGSDEDMVALVNAYRASRPPNALNPRGLGPIDPGQFDTNEFFSLDVRATKVLPLSDRQRIEVIAQVFNLLNRKNLLAAWTTNSLSNVFGTSSSAGPMRQAELAVRFAW